MGCRSPALWRLTGTWGHEWDQNQRRHDASASASPRGREGTSGTHSVGGAAPRPPLLRSISVPAPPLPSPPAMDVTYAVVNKGRGRGKGQAISGGEHGTSGRDHASSARDLAQSGRDHVTRDHVHFIGDHAPFGRDHALSGSPTHPRSPAHSGKPMGTPPDGAYEEVTPPGDSAAPALGFRDRPPKPRGPRAPPPHWGQL
ncbi:tyrosine-protein phosphatase non-receptor type 18-like isoform X2 [Lagopus leucura]|uniref:tyrosine-protein phosphatase non-receptor type 18-like isoform X2 n=1 Tax=Lagopus leucura TaxID=30410 RepID=UPI001C675D66|nr:tyrosine-protein phosphatase non-receptor type 18-like isoform X2 [Lagopus leucura]